jgi:hypothetical protein
MSNKEIAIKWAKAVVKYQDKLVYADKFFDPFNDNMRMVIIRQLAKEGIVAWWDCKEGAFIFKEDDPRFHMETDETHAAGVWVGGTEDAPEITILPTLELA